MKSHYQTNETTEEFVEPTSQRIIVINFGQLQSKRRSEKIKAEVIPSKTEMSSPEIYRKLLLYCLIPVTVVFTVTTILANGLFLIININRRHIRDMRIKLLMALSVVDFLQGLLSWPSTTYIFIQAYQEEFVEAGEKLNIISGYTLSFSSGTMLFVIALEQYFAVLHPYRHQMLFRAKKVLAPALIFNIILLVIGAVLYTKAIDWWNIFVISVQCILFVSFFVTAYFYIRVWLVSRRIQRDISNYDREEGLRIKKESKAAKTSCLVLLTFLFCYAPITIIHLSDRKMLIPLFFRVWVPGMIAMSKSTWNPMIYFWRLKTVRVATRHFITGLVGIHVQPQD